MFDQVIASFKLVPLWISASISVALWHNSRVLVTTVLCRVAGNAQLSCMEGNTL